MREKIGYKTLENLAKHALDSVEFAEYIAEQKKLTIAHFCKILKSAIEYHRERDVIEGI